MQLHFSIKQFIAYLLFSVCLQGFCQTARIDSIKNVLRSEEQSDKGRLLTLISLCGQYNSLHPDSLIQYVQESKRLAVKVKDFQSIILSEYYTALYNSKRGRVDTAMSIVDKELADKKVLAITSLADKFRLSKTALLIRQNRLKDAMANALNLLHESEEKGIIDDQLKALIQVGWVYMELNQNNEALNWFFKSLQFNSRERKLPEPSVLNSDIAAVYDNLGKSDSADIFINRAIDQAIGEQDLSFLCNSYYIYAEICVGTKRNNKAEDLLKKGVEIRKKIGDPFYIVADLAELGNFYINSNQHEKGIATIKEGIDIATKFKIQEKLLFLYSMLAQGYKGEHDLKNYSATLNRIIDLKDTIYSQNSAEALSELQAKYEHKKEENTIIQQRLDLAKKNNWIYGSLILMIFGVLLSLINYKNNQRKQRQRMELALLEEKRFSEKAILLAEEKERKRIAADLHDNLGAYAAAISANVDSINITDKNEKNSQALEALRSNSQAIVSQLNDTIWILTKEELALTAISDRLKVFIQRLQKSYPSVQIDVREQIETDHLLAPLQALHLFKILQEAIINALRHSGCSQISIQIQSNLRWKIIIDDNGNGISEKPSSANGGNGLSNMKNRTKEAGWEISWSQKLPTGTQVVISTTTN